MDIYCPICAEPYDMDELHEEIAERVNAGTMPNLPREEYGELYDQIKDEFYSKGCKTFSWVKPEDCVPDTSGRAYIAAALYDAFGHDLDGVASDLADLGW